MGMPMVLPLGTCSTELCQPPTSSGLLILVLSGRVIKNALDRNFPDYTELHPKLNLWSSLLISVSQVTISCYEYV